MNNDSLLHLTIYDRIATLIHERDLSEREFLMAAHVSRNAMYHLKTRGQIPGGDTLLIIADYLGVSVDYILGRTNKREINI